MPGQLATVPLMQIVIIPVTELAQNCSLLICEHTGRAAVVDPGGETDRIVQQAEAQGASIEKILVTHGHLDHAGGVADLAERLGVPIEGPHVEDHFLLESLPEWCQRFGFPPCRAFEPDRWLDEGDAVGFGDQTLQVRHCPGHTPGHVIFFHPGERLALVGDVLFQGSIGRTDFPRGDHATLLASIRERLWPLGDDVTFVPGHGPTSTFGAERRSNPFVRDS